MIDDRTNILCAVRELSKRGALFQAREVRKAAGISTNDEDQTGLVHKLIASLLQDGVIEAVDAERKRHRYFRLKNEDGLKQLIGRRGPCRLAAASEVKPSTDRFERIEATLCELMGRLDRMDRGVGQLIEMWQ